MTKNASAKPVAETARVRAKRTRFQFGLRSLLVVTLVVGAAVGILARWIALAQRQREIVAQLLEAGYAVQYDHGVRADALSSAPLPEGRYFWQQTDFWHNVVQLQSIYFVNGSPEAMNLVAELPHLEKIDALFAASRSTTSLPRFACRKRLKLLKLQNQVLGPGDAEKIAECESLTSLDVSVGVASTSDLAALGRLRQLQSLQISGPLTEHSVAAWQDLSQLEILQLGNAQQVTDKTLAAFLKRNPSLRRVDLGNCNCTVEVCEALAACRGLTQLTLTDSQLNDEGLAKLKGLRQLALLDIAKTQVRGTAFAGADSFSGLRRLSAGTTQIDDSGAFLLARLPQLRSLDLAHTKITDEACEYLGHCDLVTLNLAGNAVTDRGINLLHCEHLAKLNLDGTDVSPKAFASTSQWPCLELLVLGKRAESEAELDRVLQIPTLQKLYGSGPTGPAFHARHGTRFAPSWTKEWFE